MSRRLTAAELRKLHESTRAVTPEAPAETPKNEVAALKAEVKRLELALLKADEQKISSKIDKARQALDEIFDKHGTVPAEELMRMAMEKTPDGQMYVLPPDLRYKILAELNAYHMPKVKGVEVKEKVDYSFTLVVKKFEAANDSKVVDVGTEVIKGTNAND